MLQRFLVAAVVGAVFLVPAQSSSAATTAPNLLILRSALAPDPGPGAGAQSDVLAAGVDGATVRWYTASDAPTKVDFHGVRPDPDPNFSEDVTIRVPRLMAAGSYPVGTGPGQADISVFTFGHGAPCDLSGGTITVHDAAWTGGGDPTRFSASLRLHCDGTNDGPLTYGEMRFGEPAGATVGGTTAAPANQSVAYHATINSFVDIPYVVTNDGSAAVTPSRVAVADQAQSAYPAWSITSDRCTGQRLEPGATCTFAARFAPRVATAYEYAYLIVDDGLPAPAVVQATAESDPLPDQPVRVSAESALHGIHVFFAPASSPDSRPPRDVAGYDIVRVNPDGTAGPIIASVDDYLAHEADVTGLADGSAYKVAVRERFTDDTTGPLSVPVTATASRRQLVYEVRGGGVEDGLFVRSDDGGDGVQRVTTWFDSLSVSPDGSVVAAAPHPLSSDSTSDLTLLSLWGAAGARGAPTSGGATSFHDTAPSFESPTSVLFTRNPKDGVPALERWDLTTNTVAPVPGGAGLTDPAPAPDGAIVATDPAAKHLVTVSPAGVVAPIPGTEGGGEPVVSSSGTVAYVEVVNGLDTRLVLTDVTGSVHQVVGSLPAGAVHSPNFVDGGERLVTAIAGTSDGSVGTSDLYEVTPATGAVDNLTTTPNRDEADPVLTVAPRVTVASTSSTARVDVPAADVPAPNTIASVSLRLTSGDLAAQSPTDGTAVPIASGIGTVTGLMPGARYTTTAFYRNAAGDVVTLGSRSFLAAAAPVVRFSAAPASGSVVGPASPPLVAVGDTDTDSISCAVDGAARSCPGGVLRTSGLADGAHRFTATALNAAGSGMTVARTLVVDRTAPTVAAHSLRRVTLGRTVAFSYTGTDRRAGVASYDVRERVASYSSGFSTYRIPPGLGGRRSTSVSLPAPARGTTLCLSVRARDRVGNVSGWTHARCTTVPVDDRQLHPATSHWSMRTDRAYWQGTVLRPSRKHQTLKSAHYRRGRVYLVVRTCSACGRVLVRAGGRRLGTVSLRGGSHRAVLVLPRRSRGGSIRLTTTRSRRVNIDALALLRN